MNRTILQALAAAGLLLGTAVGSQARPYGPNGFQGRIALSHDGNFNDEDDWGAFPVAIAILDALGVKDKLVHIEYNNIIQNNDDRFEREMTASVRGAAEQYGVPPAILHNCRTDLKGALESIRNAVHASSPETPLYSVLAGPMDVPCRGLRAADPVKRQYVYYLSHSSWNDGYGKRRIEGRNKRDLIALGVKWVQVGPGNRLAYSGVPGTKSTPVQWALFQWMRDSQDQRLRWLFTRLEAEQRCDVSDATMTYFLLTGDETCDPQKLIALLDRKQKPDPIAVRPTIRLEAENFRLLQNGTPVTIGRQASQSVAVRMSESSGSFIRTEFHEIHAAESGRYVVAIQFRTVGRASSPQKSPTLQLCVNGKAQDGGGKIVAGNSAWRSYTAENVVLVQGDVIEVACRHDEPVELDFLQVQKI